MFKRKGVRYATRIAILSAMSIVLMIFEFPLPFVPSFYKIDLSEVPVLVGGFAMGPVAGLIIEFIKIIGNLCITGTTTSFVGELGNFLIGISYVVPAALIYKYHKTFKGAIVANLVGILSLAIMGGLVNALILLPAYSYFMGLEMSVLINMGSKVNPLINNLTTFILFGVVPFNLIKGFVVSLIVIVIYKRISFLLKDKEEEE